MPTLKKSIGDGGALFDHSSGHDNLYAILSGLITDITALNTKYNALVALYNAHTHECPGSSFAASRCSTPDTGAAENSLAASAASAGSTNTLTTTQES